MKESYRGIDLLKYIVAFLVVGIHLLPFKDINDSVSWLFTDVICRIAVPFYFISAGYFLYGKGINRIIKYVKRILTLYIIYTILYIPMILIEYRAKGFTVKQMAVTFFKESLFKGSYTHLWFFPALSIGACLCYLLFRYVSNVKIVTGVITIFYFVGVLGNEFQFLFRDTMDFYYEIFFTTRNGVFFAFPLIAIGYMLRIPSFNWIIERCAAVSTLLICLMLFVAEKYLCFTIVGDKMGNDMSIFLLPLSVVIFSNAVSSNRICINTEYLRGQSTLIYGFHMLVNFICAKIWIRLPISVNSLMNYIAVSILSALIAVYIYKISKKTNIGSNLKYLY